MYTILQMLSDGALPPIVDLSVQTVAAIFIFDFLIVALAYTDKRNPVRWILMVALFVLVLIATLP